MGTSRAFPLLYWSDIKIIKIRYTIFVPRKCFIVEIENERWGYKIYFLIVISINLFSYNQIFFLRMPRDANQSTNHYPRNLLGRARLNQLIVSCDQIHNHPGGPGHR